MYLNEYFIRFCGILFFVLPIIYNLLLACRYDDRLIIHHYSFIIVNKHHYPLQLS